MSMSAHCLSNSLGEYSWCDRYYAGKSLFILGLIIFVDQYVGPDEVRATSDESSTRLFYWRRTRELLILLLNPVKKAYLLIYI